MFEINGLDSVQKLITQMPQDLAIELQNAVEKMGDVVLRRAQLKAPGNLKNGIEKKSATNKAGKIIGRLTLKRGYGYGVPVELGHKLVAWGRKTGKHINERPFLRPAADESADEIEKIAIDATDRILRRYSE